MKNTQIRLTVSIEPEIDNLLEKGSFNKSKLINKLLKEYIEDGKLYKENIHIPNQISNPNSKLITKELLTIETLKKLLKHNR